MLQGYKQLCSVHKNRREDIYVETTKDVEKKFDTLNYKLERPLPHWHQIHKIILKMIIMKIKSKRHKNSVS